VAIFVKDPGATLDYAVDWSALYLAGQTIIGSAWAVTPPGVTVAASIIDAGKTVATLSGGVAGLVYHITNRVNFSDGRSDERMRWRPNAARWR
jgi:hypothetical protein